MSPVKLKGNKIAGKIIFVLIVDLSAVSCSVERLGVAGRFLRAVW